MAVVRNARLRTTAGRALAPQRRIEVAAWLLGAPWPLVEDTLRHEFAHILAKTLVPRSRDHGDLWRAFAVALGARPRAAYRAEEMALHWSRVTFYRCDRGCRVPRRTPYPRRRLRWLRCRRHALPLTLEAAPLPTPLRTTRD